MKFNNYASRLREVACHLSWEIESPPDSRIKDIFAAYSLDDLVRAESVIPNLSPSEYSVYLYQAEMGLFLILCYR